MTGGMNPVTTLEDAEPGALAGFDYIVDARSPGEFALDHVPGAINLPVLSNEERAEVGTSYVQGSRFDARRIGGAYVARNVARHLETVMAHWTPASRILVYCWRGGMRSGAMATILSQVGWRTSVLQGGYRTYRRRVSRMLYDTGPIRNVVLLDGSTGSGKTAVLQRLAALGVQTLDLEGLANHRGSLFGSVGEQPSQKLFESRLLAAIEALDQDRPTIVEAESSRIGEVTLPPVLWSAMVSAPRIELAAAPAVRAGYLAAAYSETAQDLDGLIGLIRRLPSRLGRRREAMADLAVKGELEALALSLIELHYDPAYRGVARRAEGERLGGVPLDRLDEAGFEAAAREVEALLSIKNGASS